MTVTAGTIAIVSGGRLTVTAETLEYYSGLALEVLARDDPGLTPATFDRALALLICHFLAADTQGDLETKSENRGGDWSFSKDPGTTTYLVQYRALIAQFAAPDEIADGGVIRSDATMTGLRLTEIDLPTYSGDGGELL